MTQALLDRRADLAGLGVEELVAQHEPVALDTDHAARDVQVVADAELADVAHVAVGRQAQVLAPARVRQAEAERLEHAQRGVTEMSEVERDRQMTVVVFLPAIDDPTVRLEPAVHDVSSSSIEIAPRPAGTPGPRRPATRTEIRRARASRSE